MSSAGNDDPTDCPVCRLFPLSGVVLFPHVVLPLHIFEPRYRQMTRDALAGDRRIAMVQYVEPRSLPVSGGPAALERVACLGEIIRHEALPDGRFNILLLGKERIDLVRELEVKTLYRQAGYRSIEEPEFEEGTAREDLERSVRAGLVHLVPGPDEFESLFETHVPLGVLTDLLAYSLPLPPAVKQQYLDEPDPRIRASWLTHLMISLPGHSDLPRFPPEFSPN